MSYNKEIICKYKESLIFFKRFIKENGNYSINMNYRYFLEDIYRKSSKKIKQILEFEAIKYVIGVLSFELNDELAENQFYKLIYDRWHIFNDAIILKKEYSYPEKFHNMYQCFIAQQHHYSNNIFLFIPSVVDRCIWWSQQPLPKGRGLSMSN